MSRDLLCFTRGEAQEDEIRKQSQRFGVYMFFTRFIPLPVAVTICDADAVKVLVLPVTLGGA